MVIGENEDNDNSGIEFSDEIVAILNKNSRFLEDNATNSTSEVYNDTVLIVINDGVNGILNISYEINEIFEMNYAPIALYKEYELDLTVDEEKVFIVPSNVIILLFGSIKSKQFFIDNNDDVLYYSVDKYE